MIVWESYNLRCASHNDENTVEPWIYYYNLFSRNIIALK